MAGEVKRKVKEWNLKIIFGIAGYNSKKKTKHDRTVGCTMPNLCLGKEGKDILKRPN